MKRLLLALLLSPAVHAATYSVALPGGSSFLLNGVLYANPDFTNSATVTWSVDGFGRILATSVGGSANVYTSSNNVFTGTNTFLVDTIFLGSASFDTLYVGTLSVTNPFPASGVTNATASRFAVFGADYRLTNDVAETGTGAPVRAVSPAFTGSPTVPTAAAGTSNTVAASTKYVDDAVAAIPTVSTSFVYPSRLRFRPIEWDFVDGSGLTIGNVCYPTHNSVTAASATAAVRAAESNHIGIVRMSTAGSANGLYGYVTDANQFQLIGGEQSEFVFRHAVTNTGPRSRIGFFDTFTANDNPANVTDGVMLARSNNVIFGLVVSNAIPVATATQYYFDTNVWYSAKVSVDQGALSAKFNLYAEDGTTLWSEAITNGLPIGSARLTGHGFLTWHTNAVTVAMDDIDYMSVFTTNAVVR